MTPTSPFRYEVQYKYSGDYHAVELWLQANCLGRFDLIVDKIPAGPHSDGSISIKFKRESDRSRFRDQVLKGF